MLRKISGTGVALVTPFSSDLSIDFDALTALVNHCIDGNIDFLVVMGTGNQPIPRRYNNIIKYSMHLGLTMVMKVCLLPRIASTKTTHLSTAYFPLPKTFL